jgi:putative DNA methylase
MSTPPCVSKLNSPCLGPALEVFSRYSRVEKANGDVVKLSEYLAHVWAAVAQEALRMVFEGADTSSFEEDARLTAMWLWTLSEGKGQVDGESEFETASSDDDTEGGGKATGGYILEYDAARKIAQGLGGHLEELTSVVEVKGDKARLLPVSERTRHLFGKDDAEAPKTKKKSKQMKLFEAELEEAEDSGWGKKGVPPIGKTTLDRIHQAMILFAAGRSEAVKRFLVEEGVGRDTRFWTLAQALAALYPTGTDERRWVEGVLARKKSLGF